MIRPLYILVLFTLAFTGSSVVTAEGARAETGSPELSVMAAGNAPSAAPAEKSKKVPNYRWVTKIGVRVKDNEQGALVLAINSGSRAENGGIQKFDLIQKVNDQAVQDVVQLDRMIQSFPVDANATVTLLRDGEVIEVELGIINPMVVEIKEPPESLSDWVWRCKWILVVVVLGLFLFLLTVFKEWPEYKKAKRMHQLMLYAEPTAIGSLKPGPVEIRGRVVPKVPLAPSPWAQKPCVFYHFFVEQWVQGSRDSPSHWKPYQSDRQSAPFQVADETGSVDVIPDTANDEEAFHNFGMLNVDYTATTDSLRDTPEYLEHLGALLKTRYGKEIEDWFGATLQLRFREYFLEEGDEIYIYGEAQQQLGRLVIISGEMPLIISDKGETGMEKIYEGKVAASKMLLSLAFSISSTIFIVGCIFLYLSLK